MTSNDKKTGPFDLTPMYEIGQAFTLNLMTTSARLTPRDLKKSILGCQNWSIILAMDVLSREANGLSK